MSCLHFIQKPISDRYINNLAKNQVPAIFHSRIICRSLSPKFVELCMETPCLCPSEGHKRYNTGEISLWTPWCNAAIGCQKIYCFHYVLQSHQSAAAGPLTVPPVDVSSQFVLSCPVLISLSVDNFFGLCRSLSTFILASLLVMPKTPEKRTDFRVCAATPKKRRKKPVMVDVDETQTDVDEGIVRTCI